ncbi:MAG: ABC transporter substrate-binding protein [Chloroflexota bacterium]|nr:ABC transporter substrate-binding protein [Chloroflexota bacterium]
MKCRKLFALSLLIIVILVANACSSATDRSEPSSAGPVEPTAKPTPLTLPDELNGKTWDEVLMAADGQTVNWWMWGGSDLINTWVNGWVKDELNRRYNITLNQVPVAGPTEFINQVLGEKEAGNHTDGSVDIMWINGENFRTMREAGLLYGPWALQVPTSRLVNWDDDSIALDFGYPVEGYELPYGSAQFVMGYNSAKVPKPPNSVAELVEWIKANPGKFTYPAPPDFTGSVFVRHMCYHATGDHTAFLGGFDEALFEERFPACWTLLNEIEPYLWREGQTYPETVSALQEMFANGEIYFEMSYDIGGVQSRIDTGHYPETANTFIFDEGTIANTNYIAIAYNSPHKAAALVTANFLCGLSAQLSATETLNWTTPLALSRAPAEWQDAFASLPRGETMLTLDVLTAHRLPELQSPWLIAIEEGWTENVLQK